MVGLLRRAFSNLHSAARLDEVSDFQLVLAAARSLLETAVDLVLLEADYPDRAVERVEAWERSAKLVYAENALRFLQEKRSNATPEIETQLAAFIATDTAAIEALRAGLWPPPPGRKSDHPSRWTGRGWSLEQDVKEAEKLRGLGFEDLYQIQYREMNWHIHGSTLTGVRGLSDAGLTSLFIEGQSTCSSLGYDIFRLGLRVLGEGASEVLEDLLRHENLRDAALVAAASSETRTAAL